LTAKNTYTTFVIQAANSSKARTAHLSLKGRPIKGCGNIWGGSVSQIVFKKSLIYKQAISLIKPPGNAGSNPALLFAQTSVKIL
jgi:hypothetical protein